MQDRKCHGKWAENDQKQRRFCRQQDLQHFGSSGEFQRGRRHSRRVDGVFGDEDGVGRAGLSGGVLASETFWSACFVSAFLHGTSLLSGREEKVSKSDKEQEEGLGVCKQTIWRVGGNFMFLHSGKHSHVFYVRKWTRK